MGYPSKFLDKTYLPYIDEARMYYANDYRSMKGGAKQYYIDSLVYFEVLARAYNGTTFADMGRELGVEGNTIRAQCLKTQYRVKTYLAIKELGRC